MLTRNARSGTHHAMSQRIPAPVSKSEREAWQR
jgi:hypothetical protein